MARRWDGAASFKNLSTSEREQIRLELGVKQVVSQAEAPALTSAPNLTSIQGRTFTLGAYAPTVLNTANEAGFKAAVNLETGVDVQAYSSTLASLASASANGVSLVTAANYAAMKGLLDLEIGTDVHAAMTQQGAITDPSGGATQDAEARTAIGSILTALRNLGLIAT